MAKKSKEHPGFDAASMEVAHEYMQKGMSAAKAKKVGRAVVAKKSRNASPAAKRANPNLRRVAGGPHRRVSA